MNSTLTLTQEWDKTFPQNDAVDHCKVTFFNRFDIELAADLYKPNGAPFFVRDYHDYYKTPRGYHPRSLNSADGWNVTSSLSLLNAKLLAYADEIRSAVLVIHDDKAYSCYFSRDAFAKLQGNNKALLLIPGAVHTDLHDRTISFRSTA